MHVLNIMKRGTRLFRYLFVLTSSVAAFGQMTYHAKILVEDGTSLPGTPLVRIGMSDRLMPACRIYNIFGNGNVEYAPDWRARTYDPATADSCPVTIRLKGYRTTNAVLRDGATIVLKRVGDHEGSTVSLSNLNAPEEAKKAYEKGSEALYDNKLGPAAKNLEHAVTIYPQYAQAWSELGEVYAQQDKMDKAKDAYERALKIDSNYIRPYVQLSRLALKEGRVNDALAIASKGVALKPVDVPAIYFYHAVASFNLKQMDDAERSARQTVQSDTDHEIPRAEYLLGSILAARGNRIEAIQHMQRYLELSPKADDAVKVKQQIAQLQQEEARARP